MHSGRALLLALTIVTPLSIQLHERGDTLATVTAADGTQYEVVAGGGEYAFLTRGCNGEVIRRHPVSFHDAGMRVQVPIGGRGLAVGVRAGVVRDDLAGGDGVVSPAEPLPGESQPPRVITYIRYVNPYVAFEPPGGSVGIGWVVHDHEFPTASEFAREMPHRPLNDLSAHVRIGSPSKYFEARWMEGVPVYSDGGYLSLGVGGHADHGPVSGFVGLAAGGPYEGAGLALRVGCDFPHGWRATVRSRIGKSSGTNASGIAVGVGWTGTKH